MHCRTIRFTLVLVLMLLAARTNTSAQQSGKPLTNSDVIAMVKARIGENTVIAAIQANTTNFDVSAPALINLKKAGVSENIINAMLTAQTNKQGVPSAAPYGGAYPGVAPTVPPVQMGLPAVMATPTPMPNLSPTPAPPAAPVPVVGQASVVFLQGSNETPIPLERTQLAETRTKPTSMNSLASDSALGVALQAGVNTTVTEAAMRSSSMGASSALGQVQTAFSGILARHKPAVTYVWALPGASSTSIAPTNQPGFVVNFKDVMGADPAAFAPEIVKLTPSQNGFRLVSATSGEEDATSSFSANWQVYQHFLEDRVPAEVQPLSTGRYRISSISALPPGEYAVVLRPISKTMKFSGGDVARFQGAGVIFDSAWPFQVRAESATVHQ